MKKMLIVTVLISAWLCGCGLTPKAAAYKSLASVGFAVDGAMSAYGQLCAQGKVDALTQKKIDYIHDLEFNPAYKLALQTAKLDYTKPTPAELGTIATQLIDLINQLVHPKPVTP